MFKHGLESQKRNTEHIQLEASQLETESKSLKLEIINLKTTVDRQLNDLDTIAKQIEDAKNLNNEEYTIIKSEAVELQKVIKETKRKSDTQT